MESITMLYDQHVPERSARGQPGVRTRGAERLPARWRTEPSCPASRRPEGGKPRGSPFQKAGRPLLQKRGREEWPPWIAEHKGRYVVLSANPLIRSLHVRFGSHPKHGGLQLPALIAGAGKPAALRLDRVLHGQHRNKNTRTAYTRAAWVLKKTGSTLERGRRRRWIQKLRELLLHWARGLTTGISAHMWTAAIVVVSAERVSGGTTKRPALARCLKSLRAGDTLIVWKIDRLARADPAHLPGVSLDTSLGTPQKQRQKGAKESYSCRRCQTCLFPTLPSGVETTM